MDIQLETEIPEHLLPFERAARIYCEQAGLAPDDTAKVPHPLVKGAMVDSWPQWTNIALRMHELSMLLSAMKRSATEEMTH